MSNSNYSSGGNKDYSYRTSDTYDDVVTKKQCRQCYKPIIAGYNISADRFTTYEIEGYPNQLIEHEHPVDNITRVDLQHRTAIEFRHIQRPNRDDRRYLIDDKRRVMI